MKPRDALDKHKRDLQQQLGMEKYLSVAVDGYYVPDRHKVYRSAFRITKPIRNDLIFCSALTHWLLKAMVPGSPLNATCGSK